MKYVSYIFEDQDVCNTVAQNEYLVEIASNAVIHHNALLESYIYNNLESFLGENLAEVYENICSFIIKENLAIYSQFSKILSDSQLSDQEKVACFETDSSSSKPKSSLAKKIGVGALGLSALGAGGAYLASKGLFGHDAENYMSNIKNAAHGAGVGFNYSKQLYDIGHSGNNHNIMDRNNEIYKGTKMGAELGWKSNAEKLLQTNKLLDDGYNATKENLKSAIDFRNRFNINKTSLVPSDKYEEFTSAYKDGKDMTLKLTNSFRNSSNYKDFLKTLINNEDARNTYNAVMQDKRF